MVIKREEYALISEPRAIHINFVSLLNEMSLVLGKGTRPLSILSDFSLDSTRLASLISQASIVIIRNSHEPLGVWKHRPRDPLPLPQLVSLKAAFWEPPLKLRS